MADLNVYYNILIRCKANVEGALLAGIADANIKIQQLPKRGENVDAVPMVAIAKSETPVVDRPFSAENNAAREKIYGVDVVLIEAKNNFSVTEAQERWVEQIERSFHEETLAGAPTVCMVETRNFEPVNRQLLSKNYFYSGRTILFHSVEQRGN